MRTGYHAAPARHPARVLLSVTIASAADRPRSGQSDVRIGVVSTLPRSPRWCARTFGRTTPPQRKPCAASVAQQPTLLLADPESARRHLGREPLAHVVRQRLAIPVHSQYNAAIARRNLYVHLLSHAMNSRAPTSPTSAHRVKRVRVEPFSPSQPPNGTPFTVGLRKRPNLGDPL
jgi:hypothetical protein